jgi:hypothetical protein
VYTGDGAPCGSPCSDLFAKGKKKLLTLQGIELLVIPFGVIIIFSLMFYHAAVAQKSLSKARRRRARTASAGALHAAVTGNSGQTKNALLAASTGAAVRSGGDEVDLEKAGDNLRASESAAQSSRYFSGLNSFKLWWAEYNNDYAEDGGTDAEGDSAASRAGPPESTNIDGEVAHSPLWQASKWRKVFWYAFGYFFLLCAVVFAAILYGRPVAHTHGLLPWARLQNWTAIQATLILVSGVMMIVYFLPLAYLPHDFVAGRVFQNDPKFLRKIGMMLTCMSAVFSSDKLTALYLALRYRFCHVQAW